VQALPVAPNIFRNDSFVENAFSLVGRRLKLEVRVQMKQFVRLAFHTTWHNFFRHCTIGGSNPVASSGGRLSMQLGASW
jgi:hypothetical protein